MNWLQQSWLETLGWTLLHSLWELSAIAAVSFFVLIVLRRHSAHLRYAVACVLLLLMMVTTAGTYAYLWLQRPRDGDCGICPHRFAALRLPTHSQSKLPPYRPDGCSDHPGASLRCAAPDGSLCRFALSRRSCVCESSAPCGLCGVASAACGHFATADHQAHLEELRRRLRLRRPVQLLQSRQVEVPTVFGAWRPLILLPLTSTTGLSTEHLTCLLLHELAHIRRHDYVANLVQSLIETLLFYHPAVIWLSAQIRQEREHCCDDIAIAHSNRGQYAAAAAGVDGIAPAAFPSSPQLSRAAARFSMPHPPNP